MHVTSYAMILIVPQSQNIMKGYCFLESLFYFIHFWYWGSNLQTSCRLGSCLCHWAKTPAWKVNIFNWFRTLVQQQLYNQIYAWKRSYRSASKSGEKIHVFSVRGSILRKINAKCLSLSLKKIYLNLHQVFKSYLF